MATYAEYQEGGDFERCPEGLQPSVCVAFVNLGLIETEFNGEKKTKKMCKFIFQTARLDSEGNPFLLFSKRMTLSAHEKSSLFAFMKQWGAFKFNTGEEMAQIDLEECAGRQATLNVGWSTKDGKTYVNITSINPAMDGQNVEYQPNEYVEKVLANMKRNGGIYLPDQDRDDSKADKLPDNPDHKEAIQSGLVSEGDLPF